jgi:outer membrane biosynthesis protein TonB
MYTGQIISGVGHAALILWLLLGDWLFSPPESPELTSTAVGLISSEDFAALQAASAEAAANPVPVEPAEVVAPPEPEVAVAPPEPEVVEPQPEPEVTEVPPETEIVPDGPEGIAEPAPLPPSDDPQPVPTPLADVRPRQRPADRIAPTIIEEVPDVDVSDVPTPEVTEQPTDDPVVIDDPVEQTAPAPAATEIVPEQPEEIVEPTLAPTSSPRPRARPTQVAAVEPEVEDPPVVEDAPDAAADDAAIEDALAIALAEEAAAAQAAEEAAAAQAAEEAAAAEAAAAAAAAESTSGQQTDTGSGTPLGESLTFSELDGLRSTIQSKWNVSALSSEALRVSVTLYVEVGQDGKPISSSIRMTAGSGGSDSAINAAYEAARRAVLRSGAQGYGLPADKYDTWRVMNLTFDPSGLQLR